MKSRILTALVGLWIGGTSAWAQYPALQDYPGSTDHWGKHIQRTMGLLAESTPENRNAVKILFYGQSIVGGKFHAWVERDLRIRFPHADLTVENKALGGFSSQYLIKTVERDVISSKPDLVIFKVQGDHILYEKIIHTIRQRTAAEVMILSSHWRSQDQNSDGTFKMGGWAAFCDGFYPLVAKKYECELVDVRWPWKGYLETNNLKASDLVMEDGVHLADQGRWLMAELINRQLLYRPDLMTETSKKLVQTVELQPEQWKNGILTFPISGSRVDLLRTHAGGASCELRIDGQKPSTLPNLTQHTRSTSIAEPYEWPEIMSIGFNALPPPQTWTLTIDSVDPDAMAINFHLEGSLTGPDGQGTSKNDFASNSGFVTIGADDWALVRKGGEFKKGTIKPGMKIRWKTVRLADDLVFPNGLLVRDRFMAQTLFHGLANTAHEITLKSDGIPPPYSHLRIYTPMIPEGPFEDLKVSPGDARVNIQDISAPTPLN